jgi:hypothetical protein
MVVAQDAAERRFLREHNALSGAAQPTTLTSALPTITAGMRALSGQPDQQLEAKGESRAPGWRAGTPETPRKVLKN